MQVFDILYGAGEDDFSSSDIVKKKEKMQQGKKLWCKENCLICCKDFRNRQAKYFSSFYLVFSKGYADSFSILSLGLLYL